ncbi:MAG: response regulator transcription factor [Candidatus Bathyarchaeota archaeon]|nr:response regulator transcription factor [Candidatus Bathyarchaeota archaeon]
MRILLIEDDENIVDYVDNAFQIGWPAAKLISAHLGRKGVELARDEEPDIILLDLGLPDMDGFDVLNSIRAFSAVPVIILTVRGEEVDVVKGLGMGADDYVVKPFRLMELLARIKALLRRQEPPEKDLSLAYGPLHFKSSLQHIVYGEKDITLTKTEGRILFELMANNGEVVTPMELVKEVWGQEYPETISNIKNYIYRLRKKLEDDPKNPRLILTATGEGYYLVKQPQKIR